MSLSQRLPQSQAYADCVKNSGDEASLQAGLRYISGGRIGKGAFFSALLGNPISGIIQTGGWPTCAVLLCPSSCEPEFRFGGWRTFGVF